MTLLSDKEITGALKDIADGFRNQLRSPILKTPAEAGLDFEDITFPSEDGVPLEAWFIPKPRSNKLLIINHPRGFSRYGMPSHLEPWKSAFAASGNDFEVDFIPDYRILNDAGYNILTYDLRNFGHSGSGNGGIGTSGRYESRDVIGSLMYVRSRPDLEDMALGLFSRCLGCNATFHAMSRHPEQFENVRCMIGVQPLSPGYFLEKQLSLLGIPQERMRELEDYIRLITSFNLQQLSPADVARSAVLPTYLFQVYEDTMTSPEDVQTIFDNIPLADKEIFWIRGEIRRWDGYTYFQRKPKQILEWLSKRMH
jgi:pimeloyl-ACP methyl ester carboxylesterase